MNQASTITIGSDVRVKRLGFGAMRLCGPGIWGAPKDPDSVTRVLQRALELGVDFIDTADAYGPAVNEEQIARALAPYADGLTIATKGGCTRGGPGIWKRDGRRAHLREACEASLQRLRLERIDLYQLHAVDPNVPFEEQIGTLRELRDEGKIRYVGLSNVDLDQLQTAERIVEIASVQNSYNVSDRESETILAYCEANGLAFIPYFPLDGGDLVAHGALEEVAKAHGTSIWQVGLAWVLQHSAATLPIPGTSSVEHLEENVGATSLRLSDAEYERLRAFGAEEEE
ncbi:MAG TPA: aldo/keto reductase [Candidatus Cybelea sp.]|nr:aldo/keto reductase [Candidatus Cybelea sp.]